MNRARLALVFLMILASTEARGGAWIRDPGSIYARTALSLLNSDAFYTRDGRSIETADFRSASLDLYAELGLGSGFDGVLTFPLYRRFAFETSEASSGIGDLGLELRRSVLDGGVPVALGLGVDLPTGDEDGTTPLKGESGASGGTIRLPTGDGETNVRATLYVSRSLDPVAAWVSAEAGYNLRTRGFTDEYRFAFQAGFAPVDPLLLTVHLRGRGPVTVPDRNRAAGVSNGLGEGVQYSGLGGGASLRVAPGVFLGADVFTTVGRVTNIYGGRNLVLGLSCEL